MIRLDTGVPKGRQATEERLIKLELVKRRTESGAASALVNLSGVEWSNEKVYSVYDIVN